MNNLDHYKNQILIEKKQILAQISNLDDRGYEGLEHSLRDSTGELSQYDNHPADNASDTFEKEKDLGIKDNAKLTLRLIEDALHKIKTGEYGYCDDCDEKINQERLEAIPYTTLCVNCRSERQSGEINLERPLEEELINELHISREKNKNTAQDGEDTWQDVAKYGTSNTPSDIIGAHNADDSYINAEESNE